MSKNIFDTPHYGYLVWTLLNFSHWSSVPNASHFIKRVLRTVHIFLHLFKTSIISCTFNAFHTWPLNIWFAGEILAIKMSRDMQMSCVPSFWILCMQIVPRHVHFGLIYLKIKGTVTKVANYNELYGSKQSWIMRQSFQKGSVQTIVILFKTCYNLWSKWITNQIFKNGL